MTKCPTISLRRLSFTLVNWHTGNLGVCMDLCFQVNTGHPTTGQTGRGLPLVCSVTPAEAASLCTKYYSLDEKERARVNLGTSSYCISCNTGDCSDCRGRTNLLTCHSLRKETRLWWIPKVIWSGKSL